MSTSKPIFENVPCGRCGGSGEHSYCQKYGRTCFGCNGKGVVLTKRGKAAQRFYIKQQMVPVRSVEVGDRVSTGSSTFTIKEILYKVVTGKRIEEDGSETPITHLKLRSVDGNLYWVSLEHEIRLIPTGKQREAAIAEALAYQETLTKQGKPRKNAKA